MIILTVLRERELLDIQGVYTSVHKFEINHLVTILHQLPLVDQWVNYLDHSKGSLGS